MSTAGCWVSGRSAACDHSAETIAAHLRTPAADTPDDPDVAVLIAELLHRGPEFA